MITLSQGQYSLSNQVLSKSTLIDYQMVEQVEVDQSDQNYLTFGFWSKYNPLGNTKLKGAYEPLDRNCFQILNSLDYATSILNLFNLIANQKFIQIGLSQTDQFIFSIQAEPSEYDDFQYFFKLSQISRKKVQTNNLFFNKLDIQINSLNYFPQFGGSLKVKNSNIALIEQGRIFSLYPGQLIVYNYEMKRIPIYFEFQFGNY
ncbi:unnamed protein product [Paramecium octaurelia]|uniref:Uncharacterized protein n=1 Tax=Paramecium octaurelia TaxID=43137 RepID=A0A8S1YSI8_PAROT|nr:unnamed protein product [Paramecium octaurelia]